MDWPPDGRAPSPCTRCRHPRCNRHLHRTAFRPLRCRPPCIPPYPRCNRRSFARRAPTGPSSSPRGRTRRIDPWSRRPVPRRRRPRGRRPCPPRPSRWSRRSVRRRRMPMSRSGNLGDCTRHLRRTRYRPRRQRRPGYLARQGRPRPRRHARWRSPPPSSSPGPRRRPGCRQDAPSRPPHPQSQIGPADASRAGVVASEEPGS